MVANKQFDDFMLEEYSNISKAHFHARDLIGSFFRYYILVITIPVSIIVLLIGKNIDNKDFELFSYIKNNIHVFWPIFIGISFVGFGIYLYVVNLYFKSILYAKTVNGVRKYFYLVHNVNKLPVDRIRVLPIDNKFPKCNKISPFFIWTTMIFALINSSYFVLGLPKTTSCMLWICFIIAILIHIITYFIYAKSEDRKKY